MVGNWKKIKDTVGMVKYRNSKTKDVVLAVRQEVLVGIPMRPKLDWFLLHGKYKGMLAGYPVVSTKRDAIRQLNKYMKSHP